MSIKINLASRIFSIDYSALNFSNNLFVGATARPHAGKHGMHMRNMVFTLLCLMVAGQALAATAFFTGRQEMVQTVTYQTAWNCQYNYAGQTFWRVFKTSCPSSVEVQ